MSTARHFFMYILWQKAPLFRENSGDLDESSFGRVLRKINDMSWLWFQNWISYKIQVLEACSEAWTKTNPIKTSHRKWCLRLNRLPFQSPVKIFPGLFWIFALPRVMCRNLIIISFLVKWIELARIMVFPSFPPNSFIHPPFAWSTRCFSKKGPFRLINIEGQNVSFCWFLRLKEIFRNCKKSYLKTSTKIGISFCCTL